MSVFTDSDKLLRRVKPLFTIINYYLFTVIVIGQQFLQQPTQSCLVYVHSVSAMKIPTTRRACPSSVKKNTADLKILA